MPRRATVRVVAGETWWTRQKANAEKDMAANREQFRRRMEAKKRHPFRFTLLLREHRVIAVLLVLAALSVDFFVGGTWLVVTVVIAFPVLMWFGSSYRERLRAEG